MISWTEGRILVRLRGDSLEEIFSVVREMEGEPDCNYFQGLFSLEMGKIFCSAAALGPTELFFQPTPLP